MFRLAGGVIGTGIIGALGWLVMGVIQNQNDIAVMRSEVNLRTVSRYTAEDARRDNERTTDRFQELDRRISRLENGQR